VLSKASDLFLFFLKGGVNMSEQLVQQRIETDETEQQIFNDNKGERYENNRQRCSGLDKLTTLQSSTPPRYKCIH
jgi:hypothetical protein